MSDPVHTALRWKGTDSGTGIFSAGEPLGKNKIIAICTCDAVSRPKGENIANADCILRACNNHYELLHAGQAVIDNWERGNLAAAVRELDAVICEARRQQ